MTNAKEEFLKFTQGLTVVAATIALHREGSAVVANLRQGYTTVDFDNFLNTIDVEYDAGYGDQELFGAIWFADDAWAARAEYDGSEWWSLQQRPEIPDYLKC